MPLQKSPTFAGVSKSTLIIDNPCSGGINTADLEYDLDNSQSPKVLNMMYRNGTFTKRYGQKVYGDKTYSDEVYNMAYFDGSLIVHSGTKIYKDGTELSGVTVKARKGLFFNFNYKLYYLQPYSITGGSASKTSSTITSVSLDLDIYKKITTIPLKFTYVDSKWEIGVDDEDEIEVDLADYGLTIVGSPSANDTINVTLTKDQGAYWQYSGNLWKEVEPYVPDVVVSRYMGEKDSEGWSYGDTIDDYNLVGSTYKVNFNSKSGGTICVLTEKNIESVEKIELDDEVIDSSKYTVDTTNGKVTFNSGVITKDGSNNLSIWVKKTHQDDIDAILENTISCIFGGNNNSRVFLAGNGHARYFYCDIYDATYFEATAQGILGNQEEDITGLGVQYEVLFAFKPKEIYSLTYYIQSSLTTTDEDQYGLGAFQTAIVNSKVGCDYPNSVQLIDNCLVWLSKTEGVCTLVSTELADERNVRPISRNINPTNRFGMKGLKSWDTKNISSVDYEQKYFLCNGDTGEVFVWDYAISPYSNTGKIDKDASRLSWFYFNNIYASKFIQCGSDLVYIGNNNQIIELNDSYNDFEQPIAAYYMTPLMPFLISNSNSSSSRNASEYLKTIKDMFVQVRGDHSTTIRMKYITNDNPDGIAETENINVYDRLWDEFTYEQFGYDVLNFANAFRRRCSIKKVQFLAVYFSNGVEADLHTGETIDNDLDCDMSLSNVTFIYQNVKLIK